MTKFALQKMQNAMIPEIRIEDYNYTRNNICIVQKGKRAIIKEMEWRRCSRGNTTSESPDTKFM